MKKAFILILTLTLILALNINVFAEGNYKFDEEGKLIKVDENFDNTVDVEVDGVKIKFKDAKPFINKQNRTVVPVRFIAEALGAKVDWDGETRTVIIDQNEKHIELKVGAMEATVNSETIKFDTKAEIYFDRTFVPLRFVSEALGAVVGWNGDTRTVTIDTKSKEKEEQVEVSKDVEEMIAKLEDEELKEIVKTVPNIQLGRDNNRLEYDQGNDFKWNTADIRILSSTVEDEKLTLITVYSRFYDKDYAVLKDMLKVYYPTKFETVYDYVRNVIDNEKPTTKKSKQFFYDGRTFSSKKLEGVVSIYIGGKDNE
ncbi:copper amine oxidase N-terminal domain-containing protein [Maledivibacter halophilus]|uniref:Copper amine oxidase N-terminal domain-containing protein n=1 Tax=Maledivibacter halophilus TaxID=36842 RepID=A0A1T5KY33_9FIRM|nr:copper amine oxidase N-terminal domain-containing protein [Maledivibacter halophilus]SKC68696.1 Copper amine oxidase N-terminal domain-containing protein [Maledivibacter halophilus]